MNAVVLSQCGPSIRPLLVRSLPPLRAGPRRLGEAGLDRAYVRSRRRDVRGLGTEDGGAGEARSSMVSEDKETRERVAKALEPNVIEDNGILIGSLGLFALWGCLLGYALVLSPNQVPQFDMYLLRKFLNLEEPDGVSINAVFTSLFYVMGLWPLMYTALLIPAAKNKTVPAMPFVALSYGIGAFGLLPFMALWRPDGTVERLPPSAEETQGFSNVITKGMENRWVAYGILAGVLYCITVAATAGGVQWRDFGTLFFMSRFVHVTTVDFMTLTLLAPFWMENDAKLRSWDGVGTWKMACLQCLPVVGPAAYLALRPLRRSEIDDQVGK
jgi:hypothetical protein